MGANAVTTVYDFTAGQVLTAAQMDNVNCGIPVFATTTTRDAAFGGTGEKPLAEGQFAYIEATNTTQYYDGSAWQTVGASGLTLISTTTIGSAVASVTVSNAFSSTYDNYQIVVSNGVASANAHMLMTLGATSAGYYFSGPNSQYGGASVGIGTIANTSSWYVGRATTLTLSTSIFVSMPNLAKRTTYTATYADTQTNGYVYQIGGFLDNATQYTAFTLAPASGTYTGGEIRVYGYQNS